MAYLSLLDDRAKPKGSRDPLGFELVWTQFGRRIVGNLTTITSSLENFAVALLGFHWVNELVGDVEVESRQKAVREYFLKYEQIAAYLRFYGESGDIMGITRVANRIKSDTQRLPIGLGADEQILSDQTGYGLWGFYSNALKDTGLIDGNDRHPTSLGMALAQKLEKALDKNTFFTWINREFVDKGELESMSTRYMRAIQDEGIRTELFELLMHGGNKQDVQKALWRVTQEMLENYALPPQIGLFVQAIKSHPTADPALVERLEDIEQVERVLVAINNIFSYCQRQNNVEFEVIVEELEKQGYDYSYLLPELPGEQFPRRDHIQRILHHLHDHDYRSALAEIFALNKHVMTQRNGAAWIELENDGRLRVRVRNETATLLNQAEGQLEQQWDYDYFLGSYLAIARSQLEANNG